MSELDFQRSLTPADIYLREWKVNDAIESFDSDDNSWVDVLSRMGAKLGRLGAVVEARSKQRTRALKRSSLVEEIEKERARIARELHAGAGQPISGILLNLEILRESSPMLSPRGQDALVRLDALADQALQQVRAVSHRLHPPAWQELTTVEAIRNLVETSGLSNNHDIRICAAGLREEPDHAAKVALYRCAQECLSNILRHSGANSIRIRLFQDDCMVYLKVEDDGHGFEQNANSGGIGLKAMQEHAGNLGGKCQIRSSTSGTEIIISIPLTENE